eukprot:Lithocolla_globosa_v1_NODE_5669_length_1204_cov_3.101828.p1 type:complete len:134 gc:universal NODE_5669_length_1204_cov_3.101828:735-334(-)
MSHNRYLAAKVFVGTGTAEVFLQFLNDKLIPTLTPFPGPRSIVVMDNASIHHDPRVRFLIENAGAYVVYLSPYSPDFNPCELSYDWIKDWLKRRDLEVSAYADAHNSLAVPILTACTEITPELCSAWFDACYL